MNYPAWVWAGDKFKEKLVKTVGDCVNGSLYLDLRIVQCNRPSDGWSFAIDFHLTEVLVCDPSLLIHGRTVHPRELIFDESLHKFAAEHSGLFHINHVALRFGKTVYEVFTDKQTNIVKFGAP